MEEPIVVDSTPETPEITLTEPDIVVPTSDSEVAIPEVAIPEPDSEEVKYETRLRHFSLEEIKQFTPNQDVINFGGIQFFITEMSESRMILKPIGTIEKAKKKEAIAGE